jgi:dihydroorotase
MVAAFDWILRGGQVVFPAGVRQTDVGIRAGKIAEIGDLQSRSAQHSLDATAFHILPGVLDTQVHFREPGGEHKEDLQTGTRAAALGGVTGIFEMPNTNPSTTRREDLQDKLRRAEGRAFVDYAFYIGASAENLDQLGELERLPGCCGVKVFMGSSTGNLLVEDDEGLAQVLAHGSRRVAVHSEDEKRLRERRSLVEVEDARVHLHPLWRDVEVARRSTERLLRAARHAGRRVHVLHVTTAEEIELLREHQDLVTVEVTPQHLTLAAPDCYDRLGTYAQMNPPLREARHRDALWRAVEERIVDVIGSDHAPHTREEKDRGYPRTPSGMPGVQTLLPILLDHHAAGKLSLERLVELTSARAAEIFGLEGKGQIAVGYDADLSIVDLKARRVIEDSWIASRCGWTPFHGKEVQGWPFATMLRGQLIMREDEILGEPCGRPFRFRDV